MMEGATVGFATSVREGDSPAAPAQRAEVQAPMMSAARG